jgi:hypothetical protein
MKNKKYLKEYVDLYRFISYFYQLDIIRKVFHWHSSTPLNKKTILEIGVGNKLVSDYLRKEGMIVKTCDIDKSLNPDYVDDIRHLYSVDKKFDIVTAYEILEHIPFEQEYDGIKEALVRLYEVSKKYVIISIPYSSARFEIVFNLSILKRYTKSILFRIPYFFKDIKFNGEHYWEMGRKGYSLSKIRKMFERYFTIKEEITPILNSYHYFFVLEKKKLPQCKNCMSYDKIFVNKISRLLGFNDYCENCGYGWEDYG